MGLYEVPFSMGDYVSQLPYGWYYVSVKKRFQHAREECESMRPTEGACSIAVPTMSTRPRTSTIRMPSTHLAIRNANHR